MGKGTNGLRIFIHSNACKRILDNEDPLYAWGLAIKEVICTPMIAQD